MVEKQEAEIDEALTQLEKMKQELLKQKETGINPEPKLGAVGVEANKEKAAQQEQVYATIQAAMTSNGPKIFIDGNIMIAKSVADYIVEYCKMAMRQHIIDNLQTQDSQKEETK